MSFDKAEKRRHTRLNFHSTIEFVLLDHRTKDEAVRKGVTINLSATGLGVDMLDPLTAGQKVIIKTGLPVDHQPATICWIKKENTGFCQAGLKFI